MAFYFLFTKLSEEKSLLLRTLIRKVNPCEWELFLLKNSSNVEHLLLRSFLPLGSIMALKFLKAHYLVIGFLVDYGKACGGDKSKKNWSLLWVIWKESN